MAAQLVPIDPEKRDDIYYRYKMPAVLIKVEGSGNGIKTVIPNIHDICLAINRPEEVLMKFFQFEMGAQRTVSTKDDKFLLMGSHTAERMQDNIYNFVRRFVLCKSCRNPETAVELDTSRKESTISMVCGACGKRSKFDDHRVLSVMGQYYIKHPEEARAAKGAAEARRTAAQGGQGEQPAVVPNAAASMRKERKAVPVSDLHDNREDPTLILARDMRECGDHMEELTSRVVRLLVQYNLPETYGPPLLLNAMLQDHSADLLATMKRYAPLLKRFSTIPEILNRSETQNEKELTEFLKRERKVQQGLLKECERICAEKYDSDRMAVMVFLLFVEGVLLDSSIATWVADPRTPKTIPNPLVDKEMKLKVAPMVKWLGLSDEIAVKED